MSGFSVTCFGVGDGWPCADRNHSSFLYRFGNTTLLLDCGEAVDRSLKASGLGYDSIDGIFLSHLHADHYGGLFMLVQSFWLERRRKTLPLFLPEDGIKPIRHMLEAGMLFDELLPFQLQWTALRTRKMISAGGVRVTPFRTTHLNRLRDAFQKKHPLRFDAFSFLIERGAKRVVHSADIGAPEDLAPMLEKPVDLLVCELAHFEPEALFAFLRDRDIKQIMFVHLTDALWKNLSQTKRLAKRMLNTPFLFAKDGQTLDF